MINFAYAQTSAQQPSMFASFIPLILIFLIFCFWMQLKEAMKFLQVEELLVR